MARDLRSRDLKTNVTFIWRNGAVLRLDRQRRKSPGNSRQDSLGT
jgi:hypothetical protein